MPNSTVPSITIGRLAVDRTQQRKDLGALLVVDVMKKAYSASLAVGVNALFVEAANEKTVNFYEGLALNY